MRAIVVFATLILTGLCAAAQSGDEVASPDIVASLEEATAANVRNANDAERYGLQPLASIIEETGVLFVVFVDSRRVEKCSATAIGPTSILTAAHCFCGIGTGRATRDFQECSPLLTAQKTRARFYSPTLGVHEVSSVAVYPGYQSPEQNISPYKTSVADLAVATVSTAVSAWSEMSDKPYSIGEFVASKPSGKMQLSQNGVDLGLTEGEVYEPGVQQYRHIDRLGIAAKGDCPHEFSAVDVYCATYSGGGASSGQFAQSGVCGGDSGSGLFRKSRSGAFQLIGVTSYRSVKGNGCRSSEAQSNYFVMLLPQYVAWIRAQAPQSDSGHEFSRKCVDRLWPSKWSFVVDGRDATSLAVAGVVPEGASQNIRYSVEGGAICRDAEEYSADQLFCWLNDSKAAVHVSADKFSLQVTACR